MTRTSSVTATQIDLGISANNGQGTTLRYGGTIINSNFTDLYTAVNSIQDYVLPTATTQTLLVPGILGGVKVDGTSITIDRGVISAAAAISPATDTPLVDGAAAIGTSLLYARQDHVHPSATIIPTGVIVMWSGSILAIPTGWLICDGNNGTPNLYDKFIVGSGNLYTLNNNNITGGSKDSVVVSHAHSLSTHATFIGSPMTAHSHTDLGHDHTVTALSEGGTGRFAPGPEGQTNITDRTTIGHANISAESAGIPHGTLGGSTELTGELATNANLPPYYALAYIMKQ